MKRIVFCFIIFFTLTTSILLATPPDWEPIQGTQYLMVVLGKIFLYANPFTGVDTCNIAGAFGPAGESDCRSIGIWQNSNPPYYDGFWYFNIVGNTNGETISFKIYHGTTDSIYNCLETIPFEDGAMIGDPYNPFALTVGSVGTNSHNVCQLGFSVYPNPFDRIITFDCSAIHNKIEHLVIYDIKGRLIRKFTYNDFSNSNILNWEGTDLKGRSIPAGIYFYKVETESLNSVGKIIYLQ